MIPSLKSIKLGGKTGGNSLQKTLKLVARAFDDRNKSLLP